jgi:hypothetical protein
MTAPAAAEREETECWAHQPDYRASGGFLCCVLPAGHEPAAEHMDPVDGAWTEATSDGVQ